jgi:hypothetical protein
MIKKQPSFKSYILFLNCERKHFFYSCKLFSNPVKGLFLSSFPTLFPGATGFPLLKKSLLSGNPALRNF